MMDKLESINCIKHDIKREANTINSHHILENTQKHVAFVATTLFFKLKNVFEVPQCSF